jgi:hypothetical protein
MMTRASCCWRANARVTAQLSTLTGHPSSLGALLGARVQRVRLSTGPYEVSREVLTQEAL